MSLRGTKQSPIALRLLRRKDIYKGNWKERIWTPIC